MMFSMAGKVALVTGASSGIGKATAALFAERGASVLLAARREKELAFLAAQITANGGRASFVAVDIAVTHDVVHMVGKAIETFGRLDYAVNAAGIEGQLTKITDLEEEDWDQVIDTNLKGTFLCMKYEARAILESGRSGAIVNVGSVNSFLGFPRGAAYAASKHAQIGLTTSASAELAPQGIRVNLVCPGIIDTPMHLRLRKVLGNEMYDRVLHERVHTRRVGLPIEVARCIAFLCSDEASYVTGTTLTPDGGFTLTR